MLTLGLNAAHSIIDFSHRDLLSSEISSDGQVPSVPGVGRGHHVLGVEHLSGQIGDGSRSERLVGLGSERSLQVCKVEMTKVKRLLGSKEERKRVVISVHVRNRQLANGGDRDLRIQRRRSEDGGKEPC
jgi:hypothetical protein